MGNVYSSGGNLLNAVRFIGEAIGQFFLNCVKIHTGALNVDGGPVTPSNPFPVLETAGQYTIVPAGTGTTPTVLKAAAGTLVRVIMTATGTALTFYDNASSASGNAIFTTPATVTVGQVFELKIPASNGLTVSQASGSQGCNVLWN